MDDDEEFTVFDDGDGNLYGSGRCRDCGAVLLDDLDDFIEAVCFSCKMEIYRYTHPSPWSFRIAWAIRAALGWPRRAVITWRVRRELDRAGLPF